MNKYIGIFDVESFHKERTDQKGISSDKEEGVTTVLRPNGYCRGELADKITLHTLDSQSPDWHDHFIVTVEKLDPMPEGKDWREYLKEKIEEKRNESNIKPLLPGRKFR